MENEEKKITELKKYIDKFPDNPNGWFNLGVSYFDVKDYINSINPLMIKELLNLNLLKSILAFHPELI